MNIAMSYGSDPSGLICGYLFSRNACGRPIGSDEAIDWLHSRPAQREGDFVWLHFDAAHVAAEKWLHENCSLSEAFFDLLSERSRSTRIEQADQGLIAIVNDVIFEFSAKSSESSEVSTLWLSVDPRVLVSVRRQPLRSIDRLRVAVKSGETFRSPLELLIHLLHDQSEVLVEILRHSTMTVDNIEDELLTGRLDLKRTKLGALRRGLVRLQRLLAPEPAALLRLLNRPPAWVDAEDAQELRQSTEGFSVVLGDMQGLQERVKLLQEEIASRISEQTNRSLFVLTAVTVLVLPINIISGLFGMNVGGVPFNQDPSGFWIVAGIVAAISIAAAWIVVRRARD